MMFQPSGGGGGVNAWATGTPYVVGDIVSYGKNLYICIVAHTAAATIEADIGAGKWEIEVKPIKLQNLCLWGNTFEDNSVGGWTACGCATVTNGFPASVGTGGAAFSSSNGGRAKGANTTSPAIVSSGQINGQYSMNFATSGAGTIGDMYISSAYPVPIKYQSKVLTFEIAFKVVSGTPVMGETSSDTYAVAIYDVANNAWIQPARCFSFTQSSGVGIASGSFQASSSMTSFQIAIYNPVAPTGASSLYFDDIYVGPQSVTWGVPITDWVSYTPTITSGAGTIVSTLSGKWRRVGDSAQIQMSYVYSSGTGAAADFGLSLPSGFSMDTGKLTSTDVLGSGFYYSGPTGFLGTEVRYFTSTSIHFTKNAGAFIQGTDADDTAAAITVTITVPIVGWSSNTVMSSDIVYADDVGSVHAFAVASTSPPNGYLYADGSAVSRATYYDLFNKIGTTFGTGDGSTTFNLPDLRGIFVRGAGSQTISGTTYSGTLGTKQTDQAQGHHHSGQSATVQYGGAAANPGIYLNGGPTNPPPVFATNGGTGYTAWNFPEIGNPITDGTNGTPRTGTQTHPANIGLTYFIKYVKGSTAQIAASSIVAGFGSKALSGTIPTGETVIDFGSTIDTNGAITTGASWKFTAPVAGKYKVTAHTEATSSGACTLYLKLYKNTTLVNASGHGVGATGYQMVPSITGIVDMNAGDYIQVKTIGSNANGSFVNDANLNWIAIDKLGGVM